MGIPCPSCNSEENVKDDNIVMYKDPDLDYSLQKTNSMFSGQYDIFYLWNCIWIYMCTYTPENVDIGRDQSIDYGKWCYVQSLAHESQKLRIPVDNYSTFAHFYL